MAMKKSNPFAKDAKKSETKKGVSTNTDGIDLKKIAAAQNKAAKKK